jgi:hypothetical protein
MPIHDPFTIETMNMSMHPALLVASRGVIVAGMLLGAIGCGAEGPIPISPTFLYDGKPLAEASISFVRTEGEQGRASFGITDSKGVVSLTTFAPGDGVMAGKYRVVVLKAPSNPYTYQADDQDLTDPKAIARLSAMGGGNARSGPKRVISTIPEVYADPGTTPLTCTVTNAAEELKFELSSKAK